MSSAEKKIALAYKQLEVVQRALERIDQSFFKVVTAREPDGIVRERVFCYELYHQMRSLGKSDDDFSLVWHGEIDKRGHEDFAIEDRFNPDFILHGPGDHGLNCVVVEVKGTLRNPEGIKNDINKLATFVEKYAYTLGIFVLYNHTLEEFKTIFTEMLQGGEGQIAILSKIFVFTIPNQESGTRLCSLSDMK